MITTVIYLESQVKILMVFVESAHETIYQKLNTRMLKFTLFSLTITTNHIHFTILYAHTLRVTL